MTGRMTVVDAGMEGDSTGLELSGPDGPVTVSSVGPDGAAVTFRGCKCFDTVKEAEGTHLRFPPPGPNMLT